MSNTEIEEEKDSWMFQNRWKLATIWGVAITILVLALFYYQQNSRLQSCRTTYEAFNKVFKPFFPKGRLTPKQVRDLRTLSKTVKGLKGHCSRQIGFTS